MLYVCAPVKVSLLPVYIGAGEVFDYLVAHGRMKEKEARVKFRQVLNGPGPLVQLGLCSDCTAHLFSFLAPRVDCVGSPVLSSETCHPQRFKGNCTVCLGRRNTCTAFVST